MRNMKETYERSSLTIAVFSKDDVIATSTTMFDDMLSLFGGGDNETIIAPQAPGMTPPGGIRQNR